jgi:hypothetical protein
LVDLKQKSVPAPFSEVAKIMNTEHEEPDMIGELERQVEIERNLYIVREEELAELKDKFEKQSVEKDALERELAMTKGLLADAEKEKEARAGEEIAKSAIYASTALASSHVGSNACEEEAHADHSDASAPA